METSIKSIILATDAMAPSHAASETAFNMAQQMGARVLIIDTLREPSSLSRWFSTNSTDIFEMVLADKQKRLDTAAKRFTDAGIEAKGEVFFGKTSEAITLAAIDNEAEMVVRYLKGKRSRFPGRFGNTSRNLMRICPCPVLFVNDQPVENPVLLACVNVEHEKSENESILRISEKLAADPERLSGVYCWDFHGKDIVQNHVSDEYLTQLLSESERIHKSFFEQALTETDLGQFAGKIRIEKGDPSDVIPQICLEESVDVAVMCSASLNHPIQRYLGSTIESILEKMPCSLLVVKPTGFKSPIVATKPKIEMAN